MRLWRSSRSASLAATNSARAAGDDLRCGSGAAQSSNSASSPQIQRASSKAVRMRHVGSAPGDELVDVADRLADLQLQVPQQVEHRLDQPARTARRPRSATRNIRSRSLYGAISPRPVPPRPTSDMRSAPTGWRPGASAATSRRRGGAAGRRGRRRRRRPSGRAPARAARRRAISARPASSASREDRRDRCRGRPWATAASRSASARRSMIARRSSISSKRGGCISRAPPPAA